MEFETLLFGIQDNVAQITLNRPGEANSITVESAKELLEAAMRCDEDSSIRAVLITGSGSMFCAGGDLKSIHASEKGMAYYLKEVTTHLHAALSCLVRMNPPVIAAVHGSAAGAGMSLACACDIVVAADSAKFTMAFTRVGVTPDSGGTYTLPRLVGIKRAVELILTNRVLSAKEALDWGIVTRVVPEKDLLEEAKVLAGQLAKGPTRTYGAFKRLLQNGLTDSFEAQMKQESRCISEMARTSDGREGIEAFLQKRAPNFKGK